jgi:hypothetical protein
MKMLLEKLLACRNHTESIKFVALPFVMRFSFELIQAGLSGGNISQSVFDNERNLQLDTVFQDLSIIVQLDLLVLNPCRLEVLERFMSARNPNYE